MLRHCRTKRLSALLAPGLLALPFAGAAAAKEFAVQNGNFTDPASWTPAGVPTGEVADINNGGTATIRPTDTIDVTEIHMGLTGGTTGTLVMDGGTVNVSGAGDSDDNTFAVGDVGRGTFTLNNGTINQPGGDFHVGKSGMGSVMTMNGGTVNLRNILRVARGQSAAAEGTLNLLGGNFNTGDGVVVARGNAGNPATGNFTIGGTTGKFVAGNSMGEGNPAGERIEGFFSVANSIGTTGNVTVRDSGVVKALRFTGRQGVGNITIQDNGQFHIVNDLGAGSGTPGTLYGSFLGGGAASNGDGSEGITGNYTLTLRGNGILTVNANAQGRDPGRPELQGFILARGNSTAAATVRDSSQLIVRQRFIIGGLGVSGERPVSLNGLDGQPYGGVNPEGTATVTVTGGHLSADHVIVGGSGNGTLNVSAGSVETQAYAATFDPDAGSGTTSVNAIRIGMLDTSTGTMNVSGTATVATTGELGIGHYGNGTLKVTGDGAIISAKDVFVQKKKMDAPTSTGRVVAQITGAAHSAIRATDSVTINGGRFEVDPASTPPATGARLYDILVADSDASGTGTLTGTFSEKSFPADDALGRRWSVLYEENKVRTGLARPGDANFDSMINGTDFALLAGNFGRTGRTWRQGDFNDDQAVNGSDFALLAGNFGRGYALQAGDVTAADWAALESFGAQIGVPVPEPLGLPALALGGLLLLRRRRV